MCYTISNFKCPVCGNMIPLPRTKAKPRERGHIKDLYCPWCKEVRKTKEYQADYSIKTLSGDTIV